MPGLPVPESGVALGPVPAGTGSGKNAVHGVQAMRFAFADAAILAEMLKHEADLRISFGKSMVWVLHAELFCLSRTRMLGSVE